MGNGLRSIGCTRRNQRNPAVLQQAGLILSPQSVESSYLALADGNCIPRRWHLEGRWGIPIEKIAQGKHQGLRFIPLLVGAEKRLPEEIQQLLKTGRAWVVPQNSSRPSKAAWTDWHPGYKASKSPEISEETKAIPYFPEPLEKSFTFAELFAGLGGFRLALEAVGGECVFASEIEGFTRALYILNFGESPPVLGDIQEVQDSAIPEVDMLVAGFPCQPFSALGNQPAFEDDRGLLFREIVRVLKASKAKSFLLENVPGLLECDDGKAIRQIQQELQLAGYEVHLQTFNARNLTAQSRKRVFFFGLRKGLASWASGFQRPRVPEVHLRAGDVLENEEELMKETDGEDIYGLSDEHFKSLKDSKKWAQRGGMTDTLVWEDKLCNTLVSHYGTSLGKGNSQLVPRQAPLNPRRFTPRECARLMGFPDSYRLTERSKENPSMWFRALYKMFGNSVSPPLVAALSDALLQPLGLPIRGQSAALRLALGAVAPQRRQRLRQELHGSWQTC